MREWSQQLINKPSKLTVWLSVTSQLQQLQFSIIKVGCFTTEPTGAWTPSSPLLSFHFSESSNFCSEAFLSCLFTALTCYSVWFVLQMYIRCTVNLCITTLGSLKCPDLCTHSLDHRSVVGSVFTSSYTVDSAPIGLVVTTAAPSTTSVVTTEQTIVPHDTTNTSSTSHGEKNILNQLLHLYCFNLWKFT